MICILVEGDKVGTWLAVVVRGEPKETTCFYDLVMADFHHKSLPEPICFQSVSIKRPCWQNHLMGSGTMIFFLFLLHPSLSYPSLFPLLSLSLSLSFTHIHILSLFYTYQSIYNVHIYKARMSFYQFFFFFALHWPRADDDWNSLLRSIGFPAHHYSRRTVFISRIAQNSDDDVFWKKKVWDEERLYCRRQE